ncbi:TRIM33 [Cordylochernes scorpioides]|uniref:TRIM33 n=1 Tax=Cordylochernes scorpioides TaxID=51811 RepID=A0ABY6LJL5_9ARAC|nr:TRIM33 [Cordylochernes scorpioides]
MVTCAICSQEVCNTDVIDNLFLLEQLGVEGPTEESKPPCCTSCEDASAAAAFCLDCQEWLCETCLQAHQRVRITKDHSIRLKDEMEGEKTANLGQKYMFCPVHRQEQLKLYCESCDRLTCRDCQLLEHKDHKYQFLSAACADEKLYLNSLLVKIKEKQAYIESARALVSQRHGEITQREQNITQEIKMFAVNTRGTGHDNHGWVSRFIGEINKRGKYLLQELGDVCSQKKTQLSLKNEELVTLSQRLQHCLRFTESAIANGSDMALVYSKKAITNQLRHILRRRCEVPNPQHVVDISFQYEGNSLSQYISQMGHLMVDKQPLGLRMPQVPHLD